MIVRINRATDKIVIWMLGVIERYDIAEVGWAVEIAGDLPIEVRLDSPGGSPYAAFTIARVLASVKGGYTCYVEGMCASAAILIALQAKRIIAAETAIFMIHGASLMPYEPAKQADLESMLEEAKVVNASMATVISARTGKTMDEALELLKRDTWFTAQQALDAKLIDEVQALERTLPAPAYEVAALYKNVPATIQALLPDNLKPQSKTSMKSFLDRVRAAFGLAADADEVDAALKLESLKAQAQANAADKAELERLRFENQQLKLNQKPPVTDEVVALVDDAVKKFQVKASDRDTLIAKYKDNVQALKEVLALIPEDAHKPGGKKPVAPGKTTASARYNINPAVETAFGGK
jgi:ATP-dependent protease ClpP protease subunit